MVALLPYGIPKESNWVNIWLLNQLGFELNVYHVVLGREGNLHLTKGR
jgi:hypothetical protein